MKLAPLNRTPLTQDEINDMSFRPHGLSDFDCRCLVAYMMGYLRCSQDINAARDAFFAHIKVNMEDK
jgi:hypothetical protein